MHSAATFSVEDVYYDFSNKRWNEEQVNNLLLLNRNYEVNHKAGDTFSKLHTLPVISIILLGLEICISINLNLQFICCRINYDSKTRTIVYLQYSWIEKEVISVNLSLLQIIYFSSL